MSTFLQAGDALATSKIAVAIVRLCWERRDLKALNAQILIIAKRRGQLKQPIIDMVTECMKYTDEIAERADKTELITSLRTVTEGKVRPSGCRVSYLNVSPSVIEN